MSDEETGDALLAVAHAIAAGEPVRWDEQARTCSPSDSDVLVALQGLQRIALAHHRVLESCATDFSHWAHLAIVERGASVDGMARCRARDALGQEFALLLIGPLSGDAVAVETLLKLARLTTTVHHPSLASVRGADYAHDCVGLWYEDEAGKTLEELRELRNRSGVDAAHMLREIARALQALHATGIVHGNVAANTIKRTADGRTVLLPSIVAGQHPQTDVAALIELLYFLSPSRDPRLTHRFANVTTATAFEAAVERAMRPPWWAREWLIGFLSAAALIGLILWLVSNPY